MNNQQALRAYAVRQDPDAFRLLVDQYQGLVFSAVSRRLGRTEDIEDVVQLTFVKLAKAAGKIHSNLAAWLHATAINTANDYIRKDRTRRRHEALVVPLESSTPDSERDEWNKVSPLIDELLLELPDAQRTLIVEHFLRGRSQRDLAEELGSSQTTVCRRLEEAVDHLRKRLAKRGFTGTSLMGYSVLAKLTQVRVPESVTIELAKIGLSGAHTESVAALSLCWGLPLFRVALCVLAFVAMYVGVFVQKSASTPLQASVAPASAPVSRSVAPIPTTTGSQDDVVAARRAIIARLNSLQRISAEFDMVSDPAWGRQPTTTVGIFAGNGPLHGTRVIMDQFPHTYHEKFSFLRGQAYWEITMSPQWTKHQREKGISNISLSRIAASRNGREEILDYQIDETIGRIDVGSGSPMLNTLEVGIGLRASDFERGAGPATPWLTPARIAAMPLEFTAQHQPALSERQSTGKIYQWIFDPKREYVLVEYRRVDGNDDKGNKDTDSEPYNSTDVSDFRRVHGILMPFTIINHDFRGGDHVEFTRNTVTVGAYKINDPENVDARYQLSWPQGVWVVDSRTGVWIRTTTVGQILDDKTISALAAEQANDPNLRHP